MTIKRFSQKYVSTISNMIEAMQEDKTVAKFDVSFDKRNGVVRVNVTSTDKQTVTKTIIGHGLTENIHYDPNNVTVGERDKNILKLLGMGLTQSEVALRMGVSQALVSKVYRSRD